MNRRSLAIAAVAGAVLTLSPLAPAYAQHRHYHGGHLVGPVVGPVVGLAAAIVGTAAAIITAPIAIAAAAVNAPYYYAPAPVY